MDKNAPFMQSTPRPSLDKKDAKEFKPDLDLNLSVASLQGDGNVSRGMSNLFIV